MKNLWAITAVALVPSAALSQLAGGAVIYDNLGSAPYNTFGEATFGLINGVNYNHGMQFTASQSIYLSTLEVAIGQANGSTLSGTATIQLMTDSANSPGRMLQTWTSSNLSNTAGDIQSFNATNAIPLTAGANYWIMLSNAPGSNLGGAWFLADNQHTGNTLTDYVNVTAKTSNFIPLTRGFRTQVSGNSWIIGDSNLDGNVSLADLAVVLNNFGQHSAAWTSGNFDGQPTIDLTDLADVLNSFGQSNPAPSIPTPEPTTLSLLALPLLLTRRRKTTH